MEDKLDLGLELDYVKKEKLEKRHAVLRRDKTVVEDKYVELSDSWLHA